MERQTQMLKGILDLCVLAILNDGPEYGYGLVGALEARNFGLVAEGSIYPLLARMEKSGVVASFKAPSAEGPSRKYYELTNEGERQLAEGSQDWSDFAAQVGRLLGPAESHVEGNL